MKRDILLDLMPGVVRNRDRPDDELKAVFEILGKPLASVESRISADYDNYFLESCEDWALPYIADLVGYRSPIAADAAEGPLAADPGALRRDIAKTIWMRRRKGTVGALPVAVHSIAGWHAVVFENSRNVFATQSVRHRGLHTGTTTPNLRFLRGTNAVDRPPGLLPRIATMRRVDTHGERGRWHPLDVVVESWPRRAYELDRAPAGRLGRFRTFSPFAMRIQLYGPVGEAEAARVLFSARRIRLSDFADDGEAKRRFYGETRAICLYQRTKAGRVEPVDASRVSFGRLNLGDRSRSGPDWTIDPEQGLIEPAGRNRGEMLVRYYYEFGGDIGGGAYRRADAGYDTPPRGRRASIVDMAGHAADNGVASVVLADNETYWWQAPDATELGELPQLRLLEVRAAPGCRPTIRVGKPHPPLDLKAEYAKTVSFEGVALCCTGLRLAGVRLHLTDVTLLTLSADQASPASIEATEGNGTLIIERSIVGQIVARQHVALDAMLSDTIVQAEEDGNRAVEGKVALQLHRCTLVQQAAGGLGADVAVTSCSSSIIAAGDTSRFTFVSLRYGTDGYCQIAKHSRLVTAHDREPGAFRGVSQQLLETAAMSRLNEFVPAEARAGLVLRD